MAIDYAQIEKEYIRDSTATLNGLATKYGIASATSLYRRAKKGEWEKKRAKMCEKRLEREAERAKKSESTQEEAWEALKTLMRETLTQEWEKVKADKHPNGSQVSALTRATKDARDMGVYGVTLNEKKMIKELEALERQLAEAQEDKDSGVIIKMEGCDEYAN